ncbi:hypothetical protein GCM10010166_58170 [Couchioplanes caeruleus subsp. azureus]|nr:hypothetical protein GCM10010166_58170 [Couchioplanes caeruleus subsp. azureus]
MTLVATTLLALSVAGCANGAGSGSGAPAGAPAAETPSSAPAPSAPAASAPSATTGQGSSAKPPAAGGSRTISGKITAGVEPNCLLLGDNLLVFDQESLRAKAKVGASVTVTGRSEAGMMTTCQQGTPFIVATIRAK